MAVKGNGLDRRPFVEDGIDGAKPLLFSTIAVTGPLESVCVLARNLISLFLQMTRKRLRVWRVRASSERSSYALYDQS